MRRLLALLVSLVVPIALSVQPGRADARGVGLGAGLGIAFPDSSSDLEKYDPTLDWGFFVDIPLISTFHITPSTLVYELNADGDTGDDLGHATDVSLSFKFIVPLGALEPFAGITAGLTVTQELDPHVGLVGGLSFNLISNVDIFAQVNYRLIIQEDRPNLRDLHIYAGPLFRFW